MNGRDAQKTEAERFDRGISSRRNGDSDGKRGGEDGIKDGMGPNGHDEVGAVARIMPNLCMSCHVRGKYESCVTICDERESQQRTRFRSLKVLKNGSIGSGIPCVTSGVFDHWPEAIEDIVEGVV